MKTRAFRLMLILLAVVLSTGCALAATKKAPPKKAPAKKPAAQSTHHETVGTQQLKGEYGKFGDTYTLGKENPWNMRLNSAEYSADTIAVGDTIIYPKPDEKLLVLHYTIHNPQKSEALMRFDTLAITAVDAKDKNWEFRGDVGNETTKQAVGQQFKPAQKMDVYAVIAVPAEGEVPKIMFKSIDQLVIRYDLRGKVKGLPAPYADPSDPTGATARKVTPAEFGVFYPLGQLALKIEGTSFSDTAIGEMEIEEGGCLFIIAATAKNLDKAPTLLRFDSFNVKLKDVDGTEIQSRQDTYRASSDKAFGGDLEPGQELKFRLIMSIEKGIEPKTATVINYNADCRPIEFQLK